MPAVPADRVDEVLAEIIRFRIIVLLVLNDHGAAARHLLLLAGAQGFHPSGNPRWINAYIVGVNRAEGVDGIDVLRREATGLIGAGISIAVRVLGGGGTGEDAGDNRGENDVLHLLVISLVRLSVLQELLRSIDALRQDPT